MADELLSRIRAEIDARMRELRPSLEEYEQMLAAADALERRGSGDDGRVQPAAPRRAGRRAPPVSRAAVAGARGGRPREAGSAAQQAIVAALEHGSHTVAELVVVTAMSAPSIRESLRRLQRSGAVTRARRDGKAAYALSR
jgi:DNA-binding transcriptional ArsR family regulator